MLLFRLLGWLVRLLFVGRSALVLENLALRQQLAALTRTPKQPRLTVFDRLFWAGLVEAWSEWASALAIVKPETVIRWHRQGFKLYWWWKSHRHVGRPTIDRTVVTLIRHMAKENLTWGVPRIRSELALLGHDVAESTVAKYMPKRPKPPSQTWKTFLANHVGSLVSIDFCVVPTVTFKCLYLFVVLAHDRRRVLHWAVTSQPSAEWVAQQLREAFPFDTAPKYLIRDRDGVYGEAVTRCLANMGVEEVPIAPRSPWQSPYVERFFGSLRRECLNRVIILNEAHLRRIVKSYLEYYHGARTHMSLNCNSPEPRSVEPPERGRVIAIPHLGGLHHRYTRAA